MANRNIWTDSNFEITSRRRKGFPSETQLKRGVRVVHGNNELFEKLGRNDHCRCRLGRSFKEVLPPPGPLVGPIEIFPRVSVRYALSMRPPLKN
jgi:hypothetical protein